MTTELPEGHSPGHAEVPLALKSNEGLGPLYAKRDHVAQGTHYTRHVSAMTGEGLHAKSAIAAELAHRDMEIARQRAAMEDATYQLSKARIWGGMDWHYNPLHPMHYKRALDRLREVLDRA